jgi:hypothetical protein
MACQAGPGIQSIPCSRREPGTLQGTPAPVGAARRNAGFAGRR